MRDPRALETALFRPQTGYCEAVAAEAAALMESLANLGHMDKSGTPHNTDAAIQSVV